ncbi:MAG: HAD-IC family P-type ATPase [Bacteroidetes bacterium]|nr:HAD-IC family P-type ATPase [Bacteroidota bacterium]
MTQPCIHCGEDCGSHPVQWNDLPFCCQGCKTVYQILNEKDLRQYYEIEKMPGIRIETEETGDKYAFLDLEEIKKSLLDFSDSGVSKVTFFIPSIHCASCIWLLENLGSLHPGVIHSTVNFPRKEVHITFRDDAISLRKLVELLASVHYIPEITPGRLDKKEAPGSNKILLLKIGITGFVLMNVMMYNFPEYLPGGELLESNFRRFFGWLSLALSIPVVVYCGNDYFLSAIKSMRHRIISIDLPIALGIAALFLQSAYEVISATGTGYLDSLAGLVFFLLVGRWYQSKTYQALSFERDYKSYFPVAVTRIENGQEKITPLKDIREGDEIIVRNRELIPADSVLINGEANIDYSFVTGESLPVRKNTGEYVFAGGRQVGSVIRLKVSKKVEQSYLTQLWNQQDSEESYSSLLKNIINGVSRWFTVIILIIAVTAAIFWLAAGELATAIFVFTSVLIVACPCALAMTIPFTFGTVMRQFGRLGFYLKSTAVVEKIYKADTIVFDKTGTITHSQGMKIEFSGSDPDTATQMMVKSVVRHSTHPLSAALFRHLEGDFSPDVRNFKEIPAMGISGEVNGIKVNVGSAVFVTGKEDKDQDLTSKVWIFTGDRVLGYYRFQNRYRDGLDAVISNLEADYSLHLITGDNEAEKGNLSRIFPQGSSLMFNRSPQDKLAYISDLREKGNTVLMVGDGLNDAGALAESDAGITIADDIYHFSPACDAKIESAKFGLLGKFIRFTRTGMNIVRISFVISFLYNLFGLYFAVKGMLTPVFAAILMPLSSISVVAFASLSVTWMARKKLR